MRTAWRELVRRPGRFLVAGGALTLIVILLLILGGILDALIQGSTGVLRAQSAPLIVYSSDARGSLDRSRVSAQQVRMIGSLSGVQEASGLGVALLGAAVPSETEPANVALFGYQAPNLRVPAPPGPGRGYADRSLEKDGVRVGQTLLLGSARIPVDVVGWVEGTSYSLQGGLWVEPRTWRTALAANVPDAALAPGGFEAILVTPEPGVSPSSVASEIRRAVPDVTPLTIDQAVAAIPGVTEQRSVFAAIIGVTFAVAGLVVALFFALITIERVGLLGMLKAIGASSRTLAAGLTLQAGLIAAGAFVAGGLATMGLARVIPEAVPLVLQPGRAAFTAAGLAVTAILGSAVSFRRVIRIDPASAVGGA